MKKILESRTTPFFLSLMILFNVFWNRNFLYSDTPTCTFATMEFWTTVWIILIHKYSLGMNFRGFNMSVSTYFFGFFSNNWLFICILFPALSKNNCIIAIYRRDIQWNFKIDIKVFHSVILECSIFMHFIN